MYNPLIHGKRTDDKQPMPVAVDANGNLIVTAGVGLTIAGTDGNGAQEPVFADASGRLKVLKETLAVDEGRIRQVAAADVIAVPGTVTTSVQTGGSCTAGTYNVKVVAVNPYGRTPATAGTARATSGGNLTVRAAFAAVTGASAYDIYVSTDTDPKWVGRITELQRASGILITAVGVTGAVGTAGAVDVQVPGTGNQAGTTSVENTAYNPGSAVIQNADQQYVDFDLYFKTTGDTGSNTLVVIPTYQNPSLAANETLLVLGTPQTLSFGGATGQLGGCVQKVRVEARGYTVGLIVAKMSGGTVDIYQTNS